MKSILVVLLVAVGLAAALPTEQREKRSLYASHVLPLAAHHGYTVLGPHSPGYTILGPHSPGYTILGHHSPGYVAYTAPVIALAHAPLIHH